MIDYEGFPESYTETVHTRIIRKREWLLLFCRAINRLWKPVLALSLVFLIFSNVAPLVSPHMGTLFDFAVGIFTSKDNDAPETIEEQLVFSGGDVELTAIRIDHEGNAASIVFSARNTAGEYRAVKLSHIKVNEHNIEGEAELVLPARCTAEMTLGLKASELNLANIRKIAFVDFDVTVYSADHEKNIGDVIWTEQNVEIKTSVAATFMSTFNTTGESLYQGDLLTLVSKGIQESSNGPELVLFLNNRTSQTVEVTIHQLKINGMPVEINMVQEVDRFKTFTVPLKDTVTGETYKTKNIKVFSVEFSIARVSTGKAIVDHENASLFVDPIWNTMSEKVPTKTPQDKESAAPEE